MRLAVVGSINIDMTVTAERIPLKGETLMGDNISYIPGGKGANQAVAMAKLGAEVEMFGCVGDDENGKKMIDNMKNHGIKTDNIKVLEGVPTGIAMITIGENDNTIIVVPGANGKVDKEYIDGIKEELSRMNGKNIQLCIGVFGEICSMNYYGICQKKELAQKQRNYCVY